MLLVSAQGSFLSRYERFKQTAGLKSALHLPADNRCYKQKPIQDNQTQLVY